MHQADAALYRCLKCRHALALAETRACDGEEVLEGTLACTECGARYPVVRALPRFVDSANYAASFGYQWKAFARTQVGGQQTVLSKIRFDATTQWPQNLEGQTILEAGCGAGRFTGIALATGAEVYSFDLSEAVEANLDNIRESGQKQRLHLCQASIYDIPLPRGTFDKVYCLGVLQHCPDVKKAYQSLVPFLKPGGELVVDCYLSQPLKHAFNLKYLLRPFFKWWRPRPLFHFWSAVIAAAYDVKAAVSRVPGLGKHLAALVPIGRLNYEPDYHFTVPEIKEIKTLSVFDMLSPKYDQPQKLSTFRAWMEEAGLEILELTTGYNGINARARRPLTVAERGAAADGAADRRIHAPVT
jgi:SAM-dependent methyltransferase